MILTMSDEKMPGQVENNSLNIHDDQKGTRGGPPMWIAIVIVGGLFLVGALLVVILLFTAG